MMKVTDYEKNKCTGCGFCISICPQKAIELKEDELGFLYPRILHNCTDCGLCYKLCPNNQQDELVYPTNTYAAVRKDREKLLLSSSGGVFAAIAELFVMQNGIASGCVLDSDLNPIHIMTNKESELKKIYGSKYVQSSMGDTYEKISQALMSGNRVLFSGTPCQVAAIKKYTKNHSNLFTVEVICHGVSNASMFKSYLNSLKLENIREFIFRDKKQGWSFNNKIILNNGNRIKVNHRLSSYMTYFLNGETYRDSCYECKYACEKRGADITIGDFWGVIKKRQDLEKKIDIQKGVSCVLVNTEKGKEMINCSDLSFYPVKYADIREGNEPLNYPSNYTEKRKIVLNIWKKNLDWNDVDIYWKAKDYHFSYKIWSYIPSVLQHYIRMILNLR